MHWRPFHPADLSACLATQPVCIGDHLVGRAAARRVWNDLVDHPSFHGTVIEADRPLGGHRIVGCGLGVFAASAFVDRELAAPRPGLNARIVAAIAAGEPFWSIATRSRRGTRCTAWIS